MKTKGLLKYVVLLVVVAIVYAVVKSQGPKEIDWRPTYDNRHKIPYGTRALFEMLPEMFEGKKVKVSRLPIYNALKNTYEKTYGGYNYNEEPSSTESSLPEVTVKDDDYNENSDYISDNSDENNSVEDTTGGQLSYTSDSTSRAKYDSAHKAEVTADSIMEANKPVVRYSPVVDYKNQQQTKPFQNYIFIDSEFYPEKLDEEELLNFAGRGNTVFIAAENFTESFSYRLGFETSTGFGVGSLKDKVTNVLRLTEGPYWGKQYVMDDPSGFYFFASHDTATTKVLGTNKRDEPNLISIKYGAGYFLISTCPKAFTNFHFLHDNNNEYAISVLSYLPRDRDVLWDQYFKEGGQVGKSENPLRVLLANESGRIALYLIAILFVLYIVFFGKRTQRIIPMLSPFTNSTVEFTQTVGRLYYQKRDHKNLALKKYYYLLDFIRQHYFMGSNEVNREFSDKLAAKTGFEPDKLWVIFSAVETIKAREAISEEELIAFNNNIEKFYTHIKQSVNSKPEIFN